MRTVATFLVFILSTIFILQGCQKEIDATTTSGPTGSGGGGGGTPNSDSTYIPSSIEWTHTGFGTPGSYAIGVTYDAQNRVTLIGGGVIGTYVKQYYYANGNPSYIIAESRRSGSVDKERNSTVFKYLNGRIVKAVYKNNSFLPETDSYYSDTIRTDNNTGYYDSLVYSGNKISEIYHKTWYIPQVMYKFTIKYPSGTDSTFSIESYDASNTLLNKISGIVSNIANPYTPYAALYYHHFNYLEYTLYYPDPLRMEDYECEYLLPLLPNAIRTFKVERRTGITPQIENGSFVYQMSADSMDLKMTNPGNPAYDYERVNFGYKKVHK